MSVWQTVLIYVIAPLAIYLFISLLAAIGGLSRRPRYRSGEAWNYPPVWWSANPKGAGLADHVDYGVAPVGASRGGAHGDW
ncbi:MAG TPA: hypothetical protein VGH89_14010 [Pseudonocardia sp.]